MDSKDSSVSSPFFVLSPSLIDKKRRPSPTSQPQPHVSSPPPYVALISSSPPSTPSPPLPYPYFPPVEPAPSSTPPLSAVCAREDTKEYTMQLWTLSTLMNLGVRY